MTFPDGHSALSETDMAYIYAHDLAVTLWHKHWKKDSPNWRPLPDLIGVLTQIDNMTVGLRRDT